MVGRVNFHANSGSLALNSVSLGAADRGAFNAICAVLAAVTTAQMTSKSERIVAAHLNEAHPTGTRKSAKMYASDADGSVKQFKLRNVKGVADSSDLARLLKGQVGGANHIAFTTLGAVPTIPGQGAITKVSGTIRDL